MSNATSLQVYVDEFDRYMLKAKAFKLEDEKIFDHILNHLTLIIYLLKDNSYSTKREFYYSDKELFEYKQILLVGVEGLLLLVGLCNNSSKYTLCLFGDISNKLLLLLKKKKKEIEVCHLFVFLQENSDEALEHIALLLYCCKDCLPVYADNRGKVVGELQFEYGGLEIDCRKTDLLGHPIPLRVDCMTKMTKREALFILLVESVATLVSLHSAGFEQRFPCIIVAGSGVPDVCSRKLVRKLSLDLKLPVLALVDGDLYGFRILTIYNKGSQKMAYDSENLTTPNIYWLGVRPCDADHYDIPSGCIKQLSPTELKSVKSLMAKPFMKNHPD
ncbi:putative DNA topoisomerase (ATP-hydrolyzing) [Medicago truncatula]|uniref:DNA topoisomerase (ATP-hydrolyzing) n=1 Tax=Medicago truncatula TaxID=3880 RepID=A0A396HV94_MEDTR|nr:putative DNA topoisomerase (ATP-hydrolyzing) [Medicago truncatula]